MVEPRILYYGGLWPTNIGNSFIDLGALYLLRKSCPRSVLHRASRFSRFYAQHRRRHKFKWLRNSWKPLDIAEHAQVDYVVVAGNVANTSFIEVEGPAIRSLAKRGTRFVVLGGGCSEYNRQEQEAFARFLRSVQAYGFVSRDQATYEAFKDSVQHAYSGIDCAFYLPEAYKPTSLQLGDYVVCTFDDQEFEKSLDLTGETVLRTRHYSFGILERFRKKFEDTCVSDLPHDYVSLYAGAKVVFSDRVHACVAALAYMKKARLFSLTPRAQLFDQVGTGYIRTRPVEVDPELLRNRKDRELDYLISIFQP